MSKISDKKTVTRTDDNDKVLEESTFVGNHLVLHKKIEHEDSSIWKCKEWTIDGDKTILIKEWSETGEGKKVGEYKEWYGNGKPCVNCTYSESGEIHGLYMKWRDTGIKWGECEYFQGKKNGYSNRWCLNGEKFRECTHAMGKLDGKYTEWKEAGRKTEECFYKSGKLLLKKIYENKIWNCKKWSLDGDKTILVKVWGETDGGKKVGEYQKNWEDGSKRIRTTYSENGELHGEYEEWYKSGIKALVFHFNNGKMDGEYARWYDYPDIRISEKCTYKNGVFHGSHMKWYRTGVKCLKSNYKNGRLHGKCTNWNMDGILLRVSEFKDGHLVGKEEIPKDEIPLEKEEIQMNEKLEEKEEIPDQNPNDILRKKVIGEITVAVKLMREQHYTADAEVILGGGLWKLYTDILKQMAKPLFEEEISTETPEMEMESSERDLEVSDENDETTTSSNENDNKDEETDGCPG